MRSHGLVESGNLLFASVVNNQIVCIDDLDRRRANIRIDDILGLVTSLRDERHCNVVLLLNEEKLDDKDIFDCHFEKAIDSKLIFAPSASDSVEHGITSKDDIGKEVSLRQQGWQFSGFDGGMSGRMTATAFVRSDHAEVQE